MSVSEAVRACWEGITRVWPKEAERPEQPIAEEANQDDSASTESFALRMAEIQQALNGGVSQNKNYDSLSTMETVSDAELAQLLGACARQMRNEKKPNS